MSNKNMSAEKSYNLIKKRMLKEIQNNDNFNKVLSNTLLKLSLFCISFNILFLIRLYDFSADIFLLDSTGGVIIMSNKNMSAEKSYNLIKKRMLKEIQNNVVWQISLYQILY
jgi:hypothetical protein